MIFLANLYLEGAAFLGGGALLGYWLVRWKERSVRSALDIQAKSIVESARREAEAIAREARLIASEEALKHREQTERSFGVRQQEFTASELRLAQRESLINQQLEGLVQQEENLREQQRSLQKKEADLLTAQGELRELIQQRRAQLQTLSHLTEVEARGLVLKEVEQEAAGDAMKLTRHILDEAKIRAETQARRIISLAIQRYAGEHTFETTTATVALSGDDIKGRIIGREGRNIRAFEAATGITVLIDDTPNAVVLSGFDPVRREIARESMERLIIDGRIHPARIEEVVAKVSQEMEETILRSGEEAVVKVGLPPLPVEIIKVHHQSFGNLYDGMFPVGALAAPASLSGSVEASGPLDEAVMSLDDVLGGSSDEHAKVERAPRAERAMSKLFMTSLLSRF